MKKITILVLIAFLISGCGCNDNKLNNKSKEYFKNELDKTISSLTNVEEESIISDDSPFKSLENVLDVTDLYESQREEYETILKNLSSKMKYEKLEEKTNEDGSVSLKVKISYYNLDKIRKEAEDYRLENANAFIEEHGYFDRNYFYSYQIEQMKNTKEMVDYTLDVLLKNENNEWQVKETKIIDSSLNMLYEKHTLSGLTVEIRKMESIDDVWGKMEISISNNSTDTILEGNKVLVFKTEDGDIEEKLWHSKMSPGDGYRTQLTFDNKKIMNAIDYELVSK